MFVYIFCYGSRGKKDTNFSANNNPGTYHMFSKYYYKNALSTNGRRNNFGKDQAKGNYNYNYNNSIYMYLPKSFLYLPSAIRAPSSEKCFVCF